MAGEATAGNGVPAGDLRASILADLAGGQSESTTEAPAPEAEEAEESTVETDVEAEEAETDAQPTDSDEEEAEDVESDDEEADFDEEPADPKVAKGLDQVRRAEKHARAKLDADRHAFEAEREQHKAELESLAEFRTLAKRAKYDPAAVLRALGLTEDDFEMVGQAIYADSKAAQANPAHKAAAAARLAQREKDDKQASLEKQLEEIRSELKQRDSRAAEQAAMQSYLSDLNAQIDASPLIKHLEKADPAAVNDGLVATGNRLIAQGKGQPTPKQVVAAYEKSERKRLEALGVDLSKYGAPKVAAKPGAKPVVATDKLAANTNGTPKKAPSRDEIVAELAKLKA